MSSLDEQLLSLRKCIQNKPPYYSGTLSPPADEFVLYYGKEDSARRIDLSKATEESVKQLASACDVATFGRNNEDVLDESYRKAGKLDRKYFSPAFDPASRGILSLIETELMEKDRESPSVRAELYKLNVYGPNSFFKAHQDTPRSVDMFGSLVVVYPVPHEGGSLVLRHEGQEWTFDSAKILAENGPEPCLSYIAFFSDVEHEVLEVTSGYRVTVTYNLYYAPSPSSSLPVPVRPFSFDNELVATMERLLRDPAFLPEGGHLGFRLSHQYPVDRDREVGRRKLSEVPTILKGSDAVLAKALNTLSLQWKPKVVIEDDEVELRTENRTYKCMVAYVMLDEVINMEQHMLEDPLYEYLRQWFNGKLLTPIPAGSISCSEAVEPDVLVHWVVPPERKLGFKTRFMTYGNEALPGAQYTHLCLVVTIPGMVDGCRGEAKHDHGDEEAK